MSQLEPKAKFAIIFGVCIVILAAVLRVLMWYIPQPTDAELAAAREKKLAEVEAVLSDGLETLVQTQAADAEASAYTLVQPDSTADEANNAVLLQHKYEANLGAGLYPQLVPFNETYILGYVTGSTFMLQQLDQAYKALGDPIVLIENLPTVDAELLLPSIQIIGEQLAILRYESITLNNAPQLQQLVELRNMETFAIEQQFIGLRTNVSAADIEYHVEQSWLSMLAGEIVIATAVNESDVSISTYSKSGQPQKEYILPQVGTIISTLGGAKALLLVSQQDDQLRFTRISADATQETARYALAVAANSAVTDFAVHSPYVATLVGTDQLRILSQDMKTEYPTQTIPQSLTAPSIVRTTNGNTLRIIHNPIETRIEGASEINTRNMVIQEYELVPTTTAPATTQ